MIETQTEVEAARMRMLEAAQSLVAVLEEACLDSAQCDSTQYPWQQVYGMSEEELWAEQVQRGPHLEQLAQAPRKAWREARREYERLIGADVYVSERD